MLNMKLSTGTEVSIDENSIFTIFNNGFAVLTNKAIFDLSDGEWKELVNVLDQDISSGKINANLTSFLISGLLICSQFPLPDDIEDCLS